MSVLSFDAPATRWLESLPLGNGALGVMHDGGVPVARLGLNDETGWSGSPASEASRGLLPASDAAAALAASRDALAAGDPVAAERALAATQAAYSQAFLPFGTLVLRREASLERYRRRLVLDSGVHEVRSGTLHERAVVSAAHGVLVVVGTGTAAPAVEIETPLRELGRDRSDGGLVVRVRFPSDVAPTHEPAFPPATWGEDALQGAIAVRVLPTDAESRWVVLLATATTYAGLGLVPSGTADDAAAAAWARVESAAAVGADRLLADATAAHGALFGRAAIDLGAPVVDESLDRRLAAAFAGPRHPLQADPGLAALLFDYGRYLAIASSRPGGLPATLQGIWNDSMQPPWSSNYTININTQMNYWSSHTANLAETAEPYVAFVLALAEAGRATARRLYGAPGWVAHHNSDAWLFSNPVGAGTGDARWTAWPMAGPWLVRGLWDAVEFGSVDPARVWPAARGAAEFALAWHHQDRAGAWVTAPATSPENAYLAADGRPVAVDATTAMDQQLLHDLFGIVGALAERLGVGDDPVVSAALRRRALLAAEPAVNSRGFIREWAGDRTEEDPHHRHLSPLYGLHPGPGDWSEPARAAAAATLERRGDDSSGWSLVWKLALWARLGRGDKVSDLTRLLFRDAEHVSGQWAGGLYPNLFAAHPPFQIDANLAFPGVLIETLLQSSDGIHLLPALPPELSTGSARGLVARPGVEVDLQWAGGALVRAVLRPRRPAELRIRYRERELVLYARDEVELTASDFEEVGARR